MNIGKTIWGTLGTEIEEFMNDKKHNVPVTDLEFKAFIKGYKMEYLIFSFTVSNKENEGRIHVQMYGYVTCIGGVWDLKEILSGNKYYPVDDTMSPDVVFNNKKKLPTATFIKNAKGFKGLGSKVMALVKRSDRQERGRWSLERDFIERDGSVRLCAEKEVVIMEDRFKNH